MAGLCGRLTLHRDLRTGRWEPDPQLSRRCLRDPQRALEYCRQVGRPRMRGVARRRVRGGLGRGTEVRAEEPWEATFQKVWSGEMRARNSKGA